MTFPGRNTRSNTVPLVGGNADRLWCSAIRQALVLTLMGLLTLIAGCTSSSSKPSDNGSEDAAPKCTEPENPYTEGTGHYAGYEWAEQKDPATCGGSSQSFIEGCEEYQSQESGYEECEAKKEN